MIDIARDIPPVPTYNGSDDYQREMQVYTEQVALDLRRDLGLVNEAYADQSAFNSADDITFTGAIEFDSTVDFTAGVNFDGSVDINDKFDVSSDVTVSIGGDLSVAGVLGVDGSADFNGEVDFSNINIAGSLGMTGLDIDGSSDLSDVYVNGDLSMTGTLRVATDFSLTGDMAVDGTSNFYSEADFSNINVAGSLEVDGSSDLSDVYANGDISMSGSLKVATDFSLTGDMAVDGTTNFNDEVDFSDTNITGSLAVDGTSTLADVSVSGWLGVDGSADFSDVHIAGNLQPTKCISDSGGFLDEDDMDSDATAAVASQQSIKAYVAAKGGGIFGDLTTTAQSACLETIAIADETGDFEHIFCASTDGFVSAFIDGENLMVGSVGDSSALASATIQTKAIGGGVFGAVGADVGAFMPVKRGEYWLFVSGAPNTDTETFYFRPIE